MEQSKVGTQQLIGPLFPLLYPGGVYWYFPRQGGHREWKEGRVVPTAGDEASTPTGDPSLAFLLGLLQPKASEISLKICSPAWSHGVSGLVLQESTVPSPLSPNLGLGQ